MSTPEYQLTIALNVLKNLGPNLYSNIPAVLSELVANSWDADAKKVSINVDLEQDRIIIEDNGVGMSIKDMNQKYLRVGYQKRVDSDGSKVTASGRHVMGRKGIGKLAVFSFANTMTIFSVRGKNKIGCTMHWEAIEKEILSNNFAYVPEPVDQNAINLMQGTRIVLSNLHKEKLSEALPTIRTDIARRFTILDHNNFELEYNGEVISTKDREFLPKIEFLWELGNRPSQYSDDCKNALRKIPVDNKLIVGAEVFNVAGWVGTAQLPSDLNNSNNIALYAHGKLIQEDILGSYKDARAYTEYIVGELNVDFLDLDDEDDIVTADRQSVNQDDPRYKAVRKFIKTEIIDEISKNWDLWRRERGANFALKISKIGTWYKSLNKTNQKVAARLFDKINKLISPNSKEKKEMAKICHIAFDSLKKTKGIASMDEAVFIDLIRSRDPRPKKEEQEQGERQPEPQNPEEDGDSHSSGSNSTRPENPENDSGETDPDEDSTPDDGYRASSPPPRADEEIFRNVRKLIRESTIEESFKSVTISDLKEAEKSYRNQGYKPCVVMLGAVLEGLMLAVLRQPSVLNEMRNNPSIFSSKVKIPNGLLHPDYQDDNELGNALAENLTFDSYRQLIKLLIPEIDSLGVLGLQHFRNAIHPWRTIKEPSIYGDYGFERSIAHLAALKMLTEQLLT